MFAPKALLIDMDDTLFDELDYVKSGFQAVAAFLEKEHDLPADYSYPSMMAFFELEGRGAVFNRVIERFEVRRAEGLVATCIDVYRNHMPDIQLYSGVEPVLKQLKEKYKLGLVTNGLPLMQQHKVQALSLGAYFDAIIFCDEIQAPKPSAKGLLRALDMMNVDAEEALMVGDNPSTDGAAAQAAGVSFVRVRTPRFAAIRCGAPALASFTDLPEFLTSGLTVK